MLITCIALAFLGYYQFNCFQKDAQENLRRMHMKHLQTKPRNSHQKHQTSELLPPRVGNHGHPDSQNSDSVLNSSSTSVDKYHRGSCRLPCHIQKTLQKLCPRRSSLRNVPPKEVLEGQAPNEGASLVLGGIGDWRGICKLVFEYTLFLNLNSSRYFFRILFHIYLFQLKKKKIL